MCEFIDLNGELNTIVIWMSVKYADLYILTVASVYTVTESGVKKQLQTIVWFICFIEWCSPTCII